jgi:hypothetical protein
MADTFNNTLEQFRAYVQREYKRSISPTNELVMIRIRYQEHRYYKGRIEMVLFLDSPESVKRLKEPKSLHWLDDAHRWLEEFQGPEPGHEAQILDKIFNLYSRGISAQRIADTINNRIVKLLKEQVEIERIGQSLHLSEDELTRYLEERGRHPFPVMDAIELMLHLGLSYEKIFEWRDEGLKNIRDGSNHIFPPDRPIDHNRVRNQIKKWEKRRS